MDAMRIFSFGGGVQSTAVMVLQAQNKLPKPYDYFVFANIGNDSENPDTLEYIEQYSKPFAEKHGIEFVEVTGGRNGKEPSLYKMILSGKRLAPIPVYGSINGAPMPRRCTEDFKIVAIAKWAKRNGAKETINGLGISTDEIYRARTKEPRKISGVIQNIEYPLIDLMISRNDCHNIISSVGLPVPPRSSCYFCPFHSPAAWLELKQKRPDLFEKSVLLEKEIQAQISRKRADGTYYLHRSLKPLDIAVGDQMNFFDELDNCESGYCFV